MRFVNLMLQVILSGVKHGVDFPPEIDLERIVISLKRCLKRQRK